ncbi:MAG: hypothetical protein DI628_05550 [Blastochloris viridis]|uniref:Uncharacterized protein n=1 Tax=Blastochloris viridis TaxID=1079 RepID=A0A6N4RBD6_BLAVI|nr:MAG: hypothetical protein DI628_05550 [Blastochloris viridis]
MNIRSLLIGSAAALAASSAAYAADAASNIGSINRACTFPQPEAIAFVKPAYDLNIPESYTTIDTGNSTQIVAVGCEPLCPIPKDLMKLSSSIHHSLDSEGGTTVV